MATPFCPVVWINDFIDQGFTINVSTYGRVAKVTPSTRDAWRAAGYEYFKMGKEGNLLMIGGQTKGKPVYVTLLKGYFRLYATNRGKDATICP